MLVFHSSLFVNRNTHLSFTDHTPKLSNRVAHDKIVYPSKKVAPLKTSDRKLGEWHHRISHYWPRPPKKPGPFIAISQPWWGIHLYRENSFTGSAGSGSMFGNLRFESFLSMLRYVKAFIQYQMLSFGGFLKRGYPELSSIYIVYRWIFHEINHPAIGVPPIYGNHHISKWFFRFKIEPLVSTEPENNSHVATSKSCGPKTLTHRLHCSWCWDETYTIND